MKLRTSCFNGAVLRKDLTRYAPVWVLYTVFWFLMTYLNLFDPQSDALSRARDWDDFISPMGLFNLFYGAVTAGLLLSDLFNSRMCNALHAMPLRRGGWLLTHTVSGVLFALIPYGLCTLGLLALMPGYAFVALSWFAVAMLSFLFFFSLALLAGMCAGSFLGMAAVYFILNFFFMLAYALYFLLYEPLLHGIVLDVEDYIMPLVPVAQLTNSNYLKYSYSMHFWEVSWESRLYLLICAGISPIAWLISLVLYRKRRLESAGDFIAFRPMAPVFLVFYTLGMGAVLYAFPDVFGNGEAGYLLLGTGLLIGYFTGKMFLEKTIRVFRLKTFIGFAILLGIVFGTLGLTKLDPLGITYYIPEKSQIVGMQLQSDENYFSNKLETSGYLFTEEADIEQLQKLHTLMALDREEKEPYGRYCNVIVQYSLTNGRTCKRYYKVNPDTPLGQLLETHLSDFRSVFHTDDLDSLVAGMRNVAINNYNLEFDLLPWDENNEYFFTSEQVPDLMAAIKADCDAGFMAQDSAYREKSDLSFWLHWEEKVSAEGASYQATYYNELRLDDRCENTIAYLKTIGK